MTVESPAADTLADTVDVSIILPVHNERDNIVPEVDRIREAMDASDYSYELICIDDASTDGSAEVLHPCATRMSFLADNYSVHYVHIDYAPRRRIQVPMLHRHEQVPDAGHPHDVGRRGLHVFGPLGFVIGLVATVKLLFDWATRGFSLAGNTLVLVTAGLRHSADWSAGRPSWLG